MSQFILALSLITLHGPGGQIIEINPAEVSSVRAPVVTGKKQNQYHHEAVQCLIRMTNGQFNAVIETCEEVDKLLANAEGKER